LCKFNIRQENLSAATKIAPGMHSPTVTTLHPESEGWAAVEVMVEKGLISGKMDELWRVGARDILVLPLLNTKTAD
jgi:ATP phosphoribosyltransferase-like protein